MSGNFTYGRLCHKHSYIGYLFTLGVRPKKLAQEALINYSRRGKGVLKHVSIFLLALQQWISGGESGSGVLSVSTWQQGWWPVYV